MHNKMITILLFFGFVFVCTVDASDRSLTPFVPITDSARFQEIYQDDINRAASVMSPMNRVEALKIAVAKYDIENAEDLMSDLAVSGKFSPALHQEVGESFLSTAERIYIAI